jgi:hypothetical protein
VVTLCGGRDAVKEPPRGVIGARLRHRSEELERTGRTIPRNVPPRTLIRTVCEMPDGFVATMIARFGPMYALVRTPSVEGVVATRR